MSLKPFTKKYLEQLAPGVEISLLGKVRRIHSGKHHSFFDLSYGEIFVQCVVPTSLIPKDFEIQSYIKVSGTTYALPEGKRSELPFEIHVTEIDLISPSVADFPEQCPPGAGPETKIEKRHFYFYDKEFTLILKCHAFLLQALRAHFEEGGFTEITPPSFSTECEGGATLFKLDYPARSSSDKMEVCLTQSSQFALEYTLPSLGDTYCIAPSFRKESSHTRRHLTEFLHAECEKGGILTFEDHLDMLRYLMRGTVSHFLRLAQEPLTKLGLLERVRGLKEMTEDIMILEHKDAIKMLNEMKIYKDGDVPFDERDDIPEAQERRLIDHIGKIVFLTKFPEEFKSFYMGIDPEDPTRVLGVDVEVPGVGEVIGSGVREHSYERLLSRMIKQGLDPQEYKAYLDLRKYGFCRTSGMGLGVGRFLTWLLDLRSIRDCTAFPCYPGHI